mmetsp:Transcript_17985/g.44905  ORF Transcript_17985/g.44905 Transcript_17985/m.44905 type:complete len:201 (+) Transcript_17985:271-873(+)
MIHPNSRHSSDAALMVVGCSSARFLRKALSSNSESKSRSTSSSSSFVPPPSRTKPFNFSASVRSRCNNPGARFFDSIAAVEAEGDEDDPLPRHRKRARAPLPTTATPPMSPGASSSLFHCSASCCTSLTHASPASVLSLISATFLPRSPSSLVSKSSSLALPSPLAHSSCRISFTCAHWSASCCLDDSRFDAALAPGGSG